MRKKRKKTTIEPLYVKDEKGKKLNVYLEINAYEAIIKKVKEFEKIKKGAKKTKSLKKKPKKKS